MIITEWPCTFNGIGTPNIAPSPTRIMGRPSDAAERRTSDQQFEALDPDEEGTALYRIGQNLSVTRWSGLRAFAEVDLNGDD